MANDTLTINTINDSTISASKAQPGQDLFDLRMMRDFPKTKVANDTADGLPEIEMTDSSRPEAKLDSWSQELAGVLKADTPREEAAVAFKNFMEDNGAKMYGAAEELNQYDAVNEMCDNMNKALEESGFSVSVYDRSGSSIELSKGTEHVTVVDVGPTFGDTLGIPKEYQSAPRDNDGSSEETDRELPF